MNSASVYNVESEEIEHVQKETMGNDHDSDVDNITVERDLQEDVVKRELTADDPEIIGQERETILDQMWMI